MTLTRRAALLGGLGVLAAAAAGVGCVESGLLPGRSRLAPLPAGVPAIDPGKLVSGTFVSAARHGRSTGWSVAYPPGHDSERLPVLITLRRQPPG